MNLKITKDTWIISDTHFGHYNMVKLCHRPLNFNERIIEKWTKLVKPEDQILHLGDLAIFFGPTSNMWAERAYQLPGDKYLIRGNHDKKEEYPGFTVVDEQLAQIGQTWILFSHGPKPKEDWWDLNIHGHMHGNKHHSYDYEIDTHHIDAGVDVFGYKPIRLGEILGSR